MKAKDILNSPDKWTKGSAARDKDGFAVPFISAEAATRCMVGAICTAYGDDGPEYINAYLRVLNTIEDQTGEHYNAISTFNDADSTTFEDVRKVLEAADV